jgi:aldo/keto reductase family protein
MSVLDPVAPSAPAGLGLAAIARPGSINLGREHDLGSDRGRAELDHRAHAILDAAWDVGVRYFDAARSYGLAEAFPSFWLQDREPTNSAVIASKWGYTYTGQGRMTEPVQERKGFDSVQATWNLLERSPAPALSDELSELSLAPDAYWLRRSQLPWR